MHSIGLRLHPYVRHLYPYVCAPYSILCILAHTQDHTNALDSNLIFLRFCCSVLQCVAVRCSVLQCVAVWCWRFWDANLHQGSARVRMPSRFQDTKGLRRRISLMHLEIEMKGKRRYSRNLSCERTNLIHLEIEMKGKRMCSRNLSCEHANLIHLEIEIGCRKLRSNTVCQHFV